MEFGKRRDTKDTTDFCPHQLVTDLSFVLRTCCGKVANRYRILVTVSLLLLCMYGAYETTHSVPVTASTRCQSHTVNECPLTKFPAGVFMRFTLHWRFYHLASQAQHTYARTRSRQLVTDLLRGNWYNGSWPVDCYTVDRIDRQWHGSDEWPVTDNLSFSDLSLLDFTAGLSRSTSFDTAISPEWWRHEWWRHRWRHWSGRPLNCSLALLHSKSSTDISVVLAHNIVVTILSSVAISHFRHCPLSNQSCVAQLTVDHGKWSRQLVVKGAWGQQPPTFCPKV